VRDDGRVDTGRSNLLPKDKNLREGGRVHRLIEIGSKREVSKRGRQGGHWLVEVFPKRKVDEGRRERIHRVIKVRAKSEVGERGWENGYWIYKRERKFESFSVDWE
jgi:hypothetical protein